MQLSKDDIQRMADREELEKLPLKPCPLCPKTGPPLLYRARHTKKWLMRRGPGGCQHAEMGRFADFAETAVEHATAWNNWVDAHTKKP
jgi:hypothetical protein